MKIIVKWDDEVENEMHIDPLDMRTIQNIQSWPLHNIRALRLAMELGMGIVQEVEREVTKGTIHE